MYTAANIPTEEAEQIMLFNWASMRSYSIPELALMYHIPNGGYRSKAEAARFKAAGVRAGVPDIFLPVALGGKHGLYVELKRLKGGTVSPNQTEWITKLREQGYRAEVCCGWLEAKELIEAYLNDKKI